MFKIACLECFKPELVSVMAEVINHVNSILWKCFRSLWLGLPPLIALLVSSYDEENLWGEIKHVEMRLASKSKKIHRFGMGGTHSLVALPCPRHLGRHVSHLLPSVSGCSQSNERVRVSLRTPISTSPHAVSALTLSQCWIDLWQSYLRSVFSFSAPTPGPVITLGQGAKL